MMRKTQERTFCHDWFYHRSLLHGNIVSQLPQKAASSPRCTDIFKRTQVKEVFYTGSVKLFPSLGFQTFENSTRGSVYKKF